MCGGRSSVAPTRASAVADCVMKPTLREPLLASNRRPTSYRPRGALGVALATILGAAVYVSRRSPARLDVLETLETLDVEVWETALSGNKLEMIHPYGEPTGPIDAIFTVFPDDEHQAIVGFGGAITQASGTVWSRLPPLQRQRVVELFFGEGGINASLARVPIGSCDFAEFSYSLDDVPGDFALSHFDEGLTHDAQLLLPLVRAALRANSALQLLASPWSPPAWMKSNGAMDGNGAPRGLRPEAAAAWAGYLSRWLAAFAAHGARVSWLTVQNEPMAPSPWEACYYNASQEASFIADHLGPALAAGVAAGRHPPVKLLGFDDQKDNIEGWAETLLGDGSAASRYTAGLAYHWYAGDYFGRLERAAAAHPSKVFLGTEATYELTRLRDPSASHGDWVRHGVWARGEGYAYAIIGDLLAGSSGWIDWNILLDHTGGPNHLNNTCDAPLVTDAAHAEVHLHPQFWYLGHFSKFTPRGSRRVRLHNAGPDGAARYHSSGGGGGGYNLSGAVAYGDCPASGSPYAVALKRPDDKLVLVALNCDGAAKVVRIEVARADGRRRTMRQAIPPRAIHTFVIDSLS